MKKNLLLLLLCIVTISCSKDDDGHYVNPITPPAWLQGTWEDENSEIQRSGFEITADDIIVLSGSSEISQKDHLKSNHDSGVSMGISEISNENVYSLKFNYPKGNSVRYAFYKINEQQISTGNSDDEAVILTKQ